MQSSLGLGAAAFAVGILLSPLLQPLSCPGSLDEIQSWALKGPAADSGIPIMGVYVFKGLNPSFLVDLSHARGWDPKKRAFTVDMGGPGVYMLPDATAAQFSGDLASTSPAPEAKGRFVLRMMRVMRHSNTFVFDPSFKRAVIHPSFFSHYNPLNLVLPRLLLEEMVAAGGGSWKRVNYSPPGNTTPTQAHYYLKPVLTKAVGARPRVHGDGLKVAKRKLAQGNASFVHFSR